MASLTIKLTAVTGIALGAAILATGAAASGQHVQIGDSGGVHRPYAATPQRNAPSSPVAFSKKITNPQQCLRSCLRRQGGTGSLYGDVTGTQFCINSCGE